MTARTSARTAKLRRYARDLGAALATAIIATALTLVCVAIIGLIVLLPPGAQR